MKKSYLWKLIIDFLRSCIPRRRLTKEIARDLLAMYSEHLVSQWSSTSDVKRKLQNHIKEKYRPCGAIVSVRHHEELKHVTFALIIHIPRWRRWNGKTYTSEGFTQRKEVRVRKVV